VAPGYPQPEMVRNVEAPSPEQNYAMGMIVMSREGSTAPAQLSHSGSLFSYRSQFVIDLETGVFCVANWTLGKCTKLPTRPRPPPSSRL